MSWSGAASAGPPAGSAEVTADRRRVVEGAVQRWCEQLVDLGGRNHLLRFPLDRPPATHLSLRDPAGGCDPADILGMRASSVLALLASNTPGAVEPAQAIEQAEAIERLARRHLEEKGLITSQLTWGIATWDEPAARTDLRAVAAPVLLRPLRLSRVAGAGRVSDVDLLALGPWELNSTLADALLTGFEVQVEISELLSELDTDPRPEVASRIMDRLLQQATSVSGFHIDESSFVACLVHSTLALVRDLRSGIDQLASSNLVAAIAGDPEAQAAIQEQQQWLVVPPIDEQDPSSEFLFMDSDSHQSDVINMVVAGANLVVDGPPGTGKSQMIANLIGSLAAHGKTALFVAEKRAAIDAVVKRIAAAGLGDLVLDLHEPSSSATAVQALAEKWQPGSSAQDAAVDDVGSYVRRRDAFARHAHALAQPREPWGISLAAAYGEIPGHDATIGAGIRVAGSELAGLTGERIAALCQEIERFVGAGGSLVTDSGASDLSGISSPEAVERLSGLAHGLLDVDLPKALALLDEARGVVPGLGVLEAAGTSGWLDAIGLCVELDRLLERFEPAALTLPLAPLISPTGSGREADLSRLAALARSPRPTTIVDARAIAGFVERWRATVGPALPVAPVPGAADLLATLRRIHDVLVELAGMLSIADLPATPLPTCADRVAGLLPDRDALSRVPGLLDVASAFATEGLDEVLEIATAQNLEPAAASSLLRRVWLESVIDEIHRTDVSAWPPSEDDRAAYCDADHRRIEGGAARIRASVVKEVASLRASFADEDLLVQAEARRRKGRRSLRDLRSSAPHVMGMLAPCWAMSPLRVAEVLPQGVSFDVVIFDEASQVVPAAAISAISRGRQVIVTGDPFQLPPTRFFRATESEGVSLVAQDAATSLVGGFESILDVLSSLLAVPWGRRTLSWHYRSKDERLIAFSNAQPSLYDGRLTTFPGTAAESPVSLALAPPSTNPDDALNSSSSEVEAVVDLVRRHAREATGRSLGVVALGIEHADRIEMALERASAGDQVLASFLTAAQGGEPFFVKNLERVQGDEREDMILSLGFHAGSGAGIRHQFGPINEQGGERRLNVAITRARSTFTLVSSFRAEDLDEQRLRGEGPKMLRRLLAYAADGGRTTGASATRPPSPLISVIHRRIADEGIPTQLLFGSAGSAIDIALGGGPGSPMRVAIEVDGPRFLGQRSVRDRERLRPEQLERLGWSYLRLRSREWLADPAGVLEQIAEASRRAGG